MSTWQTAGKYGTSYSPDYYKAVVPGLPAREPSRS